MTRVVAGMALAVVVWLTPTPPPASPEPVAPDLAARLDVMERKARLLKESMDEVTLRYVRDVYPIERALLRRARDPAMAKAAAWALVREAESRHVSPQLLAAIMQVENPWLITDTSSYAGAVGLMQVMPLHVRADHPCGTDLTDGDVSVCYGATIFRQYLGRAMDEAIRTALLRYNGCVRTPGCEVYATHVMARLE